ncbi:MAG: Eco57I restriction-modification methylase domain-containing protein, partial [Coriobacteriales bacterium]|nr:Eco57I restriction-modification methylase domain-containing protein [Coriobacteriales bacterium]
CAGSEGVESATGLEVDGEVGEAAKTLWGDRLDVIVGDFAQTLPVGPAANLLISNPPYVRHHYINSLNKEAMQRAVAGSLGIKVSGLAGLYCYFMLLAHEWLDDGAVSGWLVPSEFMDVNYGSALKEYLLDKVRLLRIHRYDPTSVQFDDALVSSAVVWFSKEATDDDYEVEFSFGGTLDAPALTKHIKKSSLRAERKWTRFPENGVRASNTSSLRLKDAFSVKRGIATGDNGFFILDRARIGQYGLRFDYLTPVLPSPRHLDVTEVFADDDGYPAIENPLFLINCKLPEHQIEALYPELHDYLQTGIKSVSDRYLCKSKCLWYQQEQRDPAPLLCTYMGRGTKNSRLPFRFILNHSKAIATNSYLMLYPKPARHGARTYDDATIKRVWKELNALPPSALTSEGRVYGGGLRKIEPRELGEVVCASCFEPHHEPPQLQLFEAAG